MGCLDPRGRPRKGRLPRAVPRRSWSSLVGRLNLAGTVSPRGKLYNITHGPHTYAYTPGAGQPDVGDAVGR